MQGACSGPVPLEMQAAIGNRTAPLQPLAAEQCVLLVDRGGFQILGDGSVWLDNLYIRKVATSRTHRWAFSLLTTGHWDTPYRTTVSITSESKVFALIAPPRVYLTGLRLQGDGVSRVKNSVNGWEYRSVIGLGVAAPTYVSGASRAHGRPCLKNVLMRPEPVSNGRDPSRTGACACIARLVGKATILRSDKAV